MPEPLKQYFLAQDNNAHWYLVEQDIRKDWERWMVLQDDDEYDEELWPPPVGAKRIDGPSTIVFCLPIDYPGLALQALVCDCGNNDQNRFFPVINNENPRRRSSLVGWRCHDCGTMLPMRTRT